MLQLCERPFIHDIAGIESRSGFEQQDPTLFFGDGTMFHSARHHDKFSLFNPHVAFAELYAESSSYHQGHLIFIVMMMKDELALKLDHLNLLSVEFAGDARFPVFGNPGELLCDVDLFHCFSLSIEGAMSELFQMFRSITPAHKFLSSHNGSASVIRTLEKKPPALPAALIRNKPAHSPGVAGLTRPPRSVTRTPCAEFTRVVVLQSISSEPITPPPPLASV